MLNNQVSKKELNKKEEKNVSGGYKVYTPKGKFKSSENKIYDTYCDFCNKKMEGRGAMKVVGDRCACINCYKKLCQIDEDVNKIPYTDDTFK